MAIPGPASAPLEAFTLFPRLPLDLRRAIWQLCRPHRVMELDAPNQAIVDTYCELFRTSILNMRPPVITRVCRESRGVAFEHASIVKVGSDLNAPSWYAGTSLQHHWFTPATDIVHLNWGPAYCPEFDYTGNPIPFFLWEAAKGKGASLTADYLYPFGDPSIEGWLTEDYDLLECRKDYLVTLLMVNLHITVDQAASSGLFGRLAEERVKLIDYMDEETIRKYHQLWLSGPQEDQEPAAFFELALSSKSFQNRVNIWRNKVDRQWLRHRWTRAKEENFAHIEEPEHVWLEAPDDEDEDEVRDRSFDFPNNDHPWVKEVLEDIPHFSPRIMFRFCEEKCYIHQSE